MSNGMVVDHQLSHVNDGFACSCGATANLLDLTNGLKWFADHLRSEVAGLQAELARKDKQISELTEKGLVFMVEGGPVVMQEKFDAQRGELEEARKALRTLLENIGKAAEEYEDSHATIPCEVCECVGKDLRALAEEAK